MCEQIGGDMRAFEAVNHRPVRGILTYSVLNTVECERGPVRGMGELRVRQKHKDRI